MKALPSLFPWLAVCIALLLGARAIHAQPTNQPPVPEVILTNQPPAVAPEPTPPPAPPTLRPDLAAAFASCQAGRYGTAGRVLKLPAAPAARDGGKTWRTSFECGMAMASGNSDTLRYTAGLNIARDRDADMTQFKAFGSYGESERVKDTENASAAARYGADLTAQAYALASLDWAYDSIAGLDYRVSSILSPGFRLIRTEKTALNVEAGVGYLEEKKGQTSRGFAAGRMAASVERIINPYVLAWCSAEYIPKLSDPGTFFANGEAGIASLLAQNLSLNIVFRERYDSDPLPDKSGSDTLLTTSLGITF